MFPYLLTIYIYNLFNVQIWYLPNEFFSSNMYTYFWFSRYIYVRDEISVRTLTKYKIFPGISADWIRETFLLLNGINRRRDIPFPSKTAERRRTVPWRGAWQNYQETIWGRRPMHPDRLRSIYAIRVTKSGTRVDGRNAFENERVREALCIV